MYVYTHNEILPSHKKEWNNNAIGCNVDGPIILSEAKSERERQTIYDVPGMWNLKYDRNELIYE